MTNMTGIDVSINNGTIDWSKVPATPGFKVDFTYIKANEGIGFDDKKDLFNAQNAKRYGIKVGYYHFASLNNVDVVADATAEANYFLKSLKTLPENDMPPVLDIETNKSDLTDEKVHQWIKTFVNLVPKCVLYSYTPFLNEHLPIEHSLGTLPLWIARYTTELTPKLPVGWKDYWMWQYSNQGKISGINGNVDLNKMKTSL